VEELLENFNQQKILFKPRGFFVDGWEIFLDQPWPVFVMGYYRLMIYWRGIQHPKTRG